MASVMANIRQELIDELEALEFFETINLIPEDKQDVDGEIMKSLGPVLEKGGKSGACVIFLTATAKVSGRGEFGPVLEDILIVARAIENPVINRSANGTGKTYEEIAEKVAAYAVGFTPLSATGPLSAVNPGIQIGSDPTYPSKDVFLSCGGALNVPRAKLAAVTYENNGGEVTLACATPGAAIFYTVDGKNPRPAHTLYAGPFTPGPGITVKARAWLAGFLKSDITKINT